MSGLTSAESAATLDVRFPTSAATDYVGWSQDGSTEWSGLVRTAVGATGWASATVADPSVKANNAVLTSAATTAATTGSGVAYGAVFSASSGGTQRTDWQALTTPRPLLLGDKLSVAIGAVQVTLT